MFFYAAIPTLAAVEMIHSFRVNFFSTQEANRTDLAHGVIRIASIGGFLLL